MIPGFEALVEERIKQAQKEGQFENLPGTHKPLKFEDLNVPEEFRMAHKILKNAGFLPPEIELRKKIDHTHKLIEAAGSDTPTKDRLNKKLNFLLTRLNLIRGDRPCSPVLTDAYRENLINKIS